MVPRSLELSLAAWNRLTGEVNQGIPGTGRWGFCESCVCGNLADDVNLPEMRISLQDKPNAGYSGTPMWKIKAQLQEQQAKSNGKIA